MADDENVAKPESPVSTETPSADLPEGKRRSEWTASDSRGPLGTAMDRPTSAEISSEDPAQHAAGQEETSHVAHESPPETDHDETASDTVEPAMATDGSATPSTAPIVTDPVKRSAWPIAAGLIVGAFIGAGSAAAVYTFWSSGTSAAQDPQIASLAGRVDALEKRPDPAGLQASVTELSRKVAAMESGSRAPQSSAPAASATTVPGPAQASVDLAPLQTQVAALQKQVESLKGQASQTQGLETKIAALEGAVAGTKKDASSAQAGVQNVEGQQQTIATEQKLLAGKVMVPALAVVADSLVQQIDRGEPYATQVAALETLGADPAKIAILKQNADRGVLSAKALAAKFAPLTEPLSATAHKAPPNAGFVDRLKSGMLSMVSVRSVDDTGGTDPAARAAQINTDLAHDDVAGALATWDALPAEAKPRGGEDWSLLAKAHAEAMGAARALQHEAIVALGAKKS